MPGTEIPRVRPVPLGPRKPANKQHKRRLNSGIGKATPSRDKKAGPSPMLDPRAWSMSTPQEREAFVNTVGRSEIEDALNAIESGCKLTRGLNSLTKHGKRRQNLSAGRFAGNILKR